QGEANDGGQCREWRVLLEKPIEIRRDPVGGRCVQPLNGGQEIYDVVVERRNGEPAELLRQPETQRSGDRGEDDRENTNDSHTADLVGQSFAGDSQTLKPDCEKAYAR